MEKPKIRLNGFEGEWESIRYDDRLLFDRVDSKLVKPQLNARFYLNLLYVALSRFRDFVTILYPEEYKETISPILES
jgi:hypothetical protein